MNFAKVSLINFNCFTHRIWVTSPGEIVLFFALVKKEADLKKNPGRGGCPPAMAGGVQLHLLTFGKVKI